MTERADIHDAPIRRTPRPIEDGWVLGPAGALIAVALGLAISLWAAAAAGLPGGDTVQLVALSFGVASASTSSVRSPCGGPTARSSSP